MSAADRNPQLREAIAEVISEKTPPGEVYGFDVGLSAQMQMSPEGPVLTAAYLLTVFCRSPVLTPPLMYCPAIIPDPCPGQAEIEAAVDECLAGLDAARKRLLAIPGNPGRN